MIHEVDPESQGRAVERVRELLAPGARPADDNDLFFVISGQGRVLTHGGESGTTCLPLFTSPERASRYARAVLGEGAEFQLAGYSARRCAEGLATLPDQGIARVSVDRCPHCEITVAFEIRSLPTAQKWVEIWALATASREAAFDTQISRVEQAMAEGRYNDVFTMLAEIDRHIDADRPEVHFWMGRLAAEMYDEALLERVYDNLRRFEPRWTDQLRQAASRVERRPDMPADFQRMWKCIHAFEARDYVRCVGIARYTLRVAVDPLEIRLLVAALQRLGRGSEAEEAAPRFKEWLETLPWDWKLVELLLGRRSPDELRREAADEVQSCQVRFWSGVRLYNEGQFPAAYAEYLAIMGEPPVKCHEYLLAATEGTAMQKEGRTGSTSD